MHEVLVNRLGGLSLPRKSVVRLTDRPDMTLDVYRGRKTTIQPTNQLYVNAYVVMDAVSLPAHKPVLQFLPFVAFPGQGSPCGTPAGYEQFRCLIW